MARRMLTLDGAPRTPGKKVSYSTTASKTVADAKRAEQLVSTVAAETIAEIHASLERRRMQEAAARIERSIELADLFGNRTPRQAKPSVTVWGALRHIAEHGTDRNELVAVARDIVRRSDRFQSEKQWSYAKAICFKPRNRALLEATYDLAAMSRETPDLINAVSTNRSSIGHTPRVSLLDGKDAVFQCLVNRVSPDYHVTFGYSLSRSDGSTKDSVRSCTIPWAQVHSFGSVIEGQRHTIAVDAKWLLDMRGVDSARIAGVLLRDKND